MIGSSLNIAYDKTMIRRQPRVLAPHTWFFWLIAAAIVTMTARNPLYSLLMLLVAITLYHQIPARGSPMPFNWLSLGAMMLILPTFFYAISLHSGTTVFIRLPPHWPLLGGPITGEAAALGASNGLLLLTLLALFAVFNRAITASDLIRLTPRALHHLGIVVLIALTYVPETLAQWQRIREAQAIRGYEPKGWQGWRPLLVPLLINGLERAMDVAEAMVARGYGSTEDQPQSVWQQMVMAGGLAAAFVGWLLLFSDIGWGWILLMIGAAAAAWLLWYTGRRIKITRYQAITWGWRDALTIIMAGLPLLGLLVIGTSQLLYVPFPSLTWPLFNPIFGASLLFFLAPWFTQNQETPA